jgi:hypothetical protein
MRYGFGFGLQYSKLSGGSVYNANYQAVIDYANSEEDTLPASNIRSFQNDFMISINPFFSKFTELHLWAGEAGLDGFKSIDFVRLNKADYYNSPSLLANGIKGNGTSSYVDLIFNYLTESQEDSITMGYYSIDGTDGGNSGVLGVYQIAGDKGSYIFPKTSNDSIACGGNTNFELFQNIGLGLGGDTELISVSHNGTQLKLNRNDTSLGIVNKTGTRPNLSSYVLARNFDGSADNFTDTTLALTFHAEELTSSELLILSNATKTYLSEI